MDTHLVLRVSVVKSISPSGQNTGIVLAHGVICEVVEMPLGSVNMTLFGVLVATNRLHVRRLTIDIDGKRTAGRGVAEVAEKTLTDQTIKKDNENTRQATTRDSGSMEGCMRKAAFHVQPIEVRRDLCLPLICLLCCLPCGYPRTRADNRTQSLTTCNSTLHLEADEQTKAHDNQPSTTPNFPKHRATHRDSSPR
jgi:hypothetical protein